MKFKLILSVAIAALIVPSISLSMLNQKMTAQEKLDLGVFRNNLALVQEALTEGADVNIKPNTKYYAQLPLNTLIGCNLHPNSEIIELLLKSGADVNSKDMYGNTPLYSMIYKIGKPNIRGIQLLLEAEANINIKNSNDKTALDAAKEKGKEEILKLFEEWPAKLRKKVKEGSSVYLISDLSDIVCDYVSQNFLN